MCVSSSVPVFLRNLVVYIQDLNAEPCTRRPAPGATVSPCWEYHASPRTRAFSPLALASNHRFLFERRCSPMAACPEGSLLWANLAWPMWHPASCLGTVVPSCSGTRWALGLSFLPLCKLLQQKNPIPQFCNHHKTQTYSILIFGVTQ